MSSLGQVETSALEEHSLAPRGARAATIQLAEQCQRFEWLLLAAATPFLVLAGPAAPVGAMLIAITWWARRAVSGSWSVSTPAHPFAALLVSALLVSWLPSVSLAYSASKFWGLLLGIGIFYSVINTCRAVTAFRRAALALVLGGLILAVAGTLGMAASGDKGLILSRIYTALPHMILPVQSSTTMIEGFNPNQVGGMLALFIPVVGLLALQADGFGRLTRIAALVSTPILCLSLLLTQSRAALGAVVLVLLVGGPAVLGFSKRKSVAVLAVGVLLVLVTLASAVAAGRVDLAHLAKDDAPLSGTASLPGRAELWQRAALMIIDMPFSGIGLNTFPLILHDFYPTSTDVPESLTPHAHNLFLQTALDLGLFGLAAFLAIAGVAVVGGLRAIRSSHPVERTLGAGLLLGVLAHAVFNLGDAVALGSKPGPALWAVLGLLVALGNVNRVPRQRSVWSWLQHRWLVTAPLAIALVAFALAPLSLNIALAVLHRGDLPSFARPTLDLATTAAWGPYQSRAWAARALDAKRQGDISAQATALQRAAGAALWDGSLALELGQVRLAQGDIQGALDAWKPARLDGPLMTQASVANNPETQLEWLSLARQVDPTDWRAYAQAGWIMIDVMQPQQPQAAAPLIATALRLRGLQPALTVVAERLDHPGESQLPPDIAPPTSQTDLQLLGYASAALTILQDYEGALFTTELIAQAEPANASNWFEMSYVLRQMGRSAEADAVYARALYSPSPP